MTTFKKDIHLGDMVPSDSDCLLVEITNNGIVTDRNGRKWKLNKVSQGTTYEYSIPVLSLEYDMIPAAGGTVRPRVEWTQTKVTYVNGEETQRDVLRGGLSDVEEYCFTGADEDGSVSVEATTETSNSLIQQVTLSVTIHGMSATAICDVYQKASGGSAEPVIAIKYVDLVASLSYTKLPAAGGSATPNVTWSATKQTYTDGVLTASEAINGDLNSPGVSAVFSGTNVNPATGVCTVESANEDGVSKKFLVTLNSITLFGTTFTLTNVTHEVEQLKKEQGGIELPHRYENTVLTLTYGVIPAEGSNEERTVEPVVSWSQDKVILTPADQVMGTDTRTSASHPEDMTSITYKVDEAESEDGKVTADAAPEGTGTRDVATVKATAIINGVEVETTCVVKQNLKAVVEPTEPDEPTEPTDPDTPTEKLDNPVTVTAKSLTYNGGEQSLVNVENAQGQIAFALGSSLADNPSGANYSLNIPVGKNAGTYYVFWMCGGNDQYKSKNGKLAVTIQEAVVEPDEPMVEEHIYYGTVDVLPYLVDSTENLTALPVEPKTFQLHCPDDKAFVILIPKTSSLVAKLVDAFDKNLNFIETIEGVDTPIGCNGTEVVIGTNRYKAYGMASPGEESFEIRIV